MTNILIEIECIFQDLFKNENIRINNETTANDIEGWDSLNNIKLIIMIEQKFKIKFSPSDISDLPNVGSLIATIERLT